jgi:RND family efflux transporter MFP subunit
LATLKSQLKQYDVRAPFNGSIDYIPVKVGEMAQPGLPLLRVVNPQEMYIRADVSEAYLGKFTAGDQVEIYFPVQDRLVGSKINSVGKVINRDNRTFAVEIDLPVNGFEYQPNQVAILKMTDYQNDEAITVPTRLIQTDDEGKFVYIVSDESGKKVASKARIVTGLSYNSRTEIVNGLKGNEMVIDKGYRDVNEGVEIRLASL